MKLYSVGTAAALDKSARYTEAYHVIKANATVHET